MTKRVPLKKAKLAGNILVVCAVITLVLALLLNKQAKKIDDHETLRTFGYGNAVDVWRWVLLVLILVCFALSINLRLFMNKGLAIAAINLLLASVITFVLVNMNMTITYGINEQIVEENCGIIN